MFSEIKRDSVARSFKPVRGILWQMMQLDKNIISFKYVIQSLLHTHGRNSHGLIVCTDLGILQLTVPVVAKSIWWFGIFPLAYVVNLKLIKRKCHPTTSKLTRFVFVDVCINVTSFGEGQAAQQACCAMSKLRCALSEIDPTCYCGQIQGRMVLKYHSI